MLLQGPRRTIVESVLPHEVSHAVFATYFGRPLPRWVEEGICVVVEHLSPQSELDRQIVAALRDGNSFAVEQMFAMKNYPSDALTFYSQGYSLTRFLIEREGKSKLIQFVVEGMESDDWGSATRKNYGFESLSDLQNAWAEWVLDLEL